MKLVTATDVWYTQQQKTLDELAEKLGHGHHAHDDEQRAAHLHRILHHVAVRTEKAQHLAREQTHRQKRQHEADRVHVLLYMYNVFLAKTNASYYY